MKTNYFLAVTLYLAVLLPLQSGAAAQAGSQKEQRSANAKPMLTNEDVGSLLKSGLSPEIVVAEVNASICDFNTSTTALQELKAAGVPDNVILAMVQAPKGAPRAATGQPSAQSTLVGNQTDSSYRTPSRGCMAVRPVGSHAFRNVMLLGVAGAFISHEQYQVVDVVDYPSHVGQKYHGNDLQTIESGGAKVALLPKHYTAEDLHKACH